MALIKTPPPAPQPSCWRALRPRNGGTAEEFLGWFVGEKKDIEQFLLLSGHAITRLEPITFRHIGPQDVHTARSLKDAAYAAQQRANDFLLGKFSAPSAASCSNS